MRQCIHGLRKHLRAILALAPILLVALWPGLAHADDPWGFDVTEATDKLAYSLWKGVATACWNIDRTLFVLCYQLDQLRYWLINTAFNTIYTALIEQIINPLMIPLATIALLLFGILFLLVPLSGRGIVFINIRQVLLLLVFLPILLASAGPLLHDIERVRATIGGQMASFIANDNRFPNTLFGVPVEHEMAEARPLYTSERTTCGQVLARPDAVAGQPGILHLDDLAAASLWVIAEDIHCPEKDLPYQFYVESPDGPGYARENGVDGIDDHSARQAQIDRLQNGVIRLVLGIFPAVLAVFEMLIQLLLALALVAIWLSLPVALLYMLFQKDAGALTTLVRNTIDILRTSWSISIITGLIFVCLEATARLGNPVAYVGLAIGALALTSFMLSIAVQTFIKGCSAFNNTIGYSLSLPPGAAQQFGQASARALGSAAGTAAGVAGGATLAGLSYAGAAHQTNNRRYALAAAIGTIRPVAALGEVATAMGFVHNEETLAGLNAGARARQSGLGALRSQAARDAHRLHTIAQRRLANPERHSTSNG